MHTLVSILICVVAIALFVSWIASRPRGQQLQGFVNVAEGFQPAKKTYLTDAAIATRYLLGKKGTDAAHIAVNGAADCPLGIITDEAPAAEEGVNVDLLGLADEGKIMIAAGVIAVDTFVYTAAGGKVQAEPTIAGTYYRVGRAIKAAAADGDKVEVIPLAPLPLVVVAAFTSTNGTAAAAADLAALKVEAEKIGDDVRALGTALATPALVKVLT